MTKVDPSNIYPEASEGRLKTTDDRSRSYSTDKSRIISEHKSLNKAEKHRAHERILFFLDDHVFAYLVFGILASAGLWYFSLGLALAGATILAQIFGIVMKALSIFISATVVYALLRWIINVARGLRKK